MEKLPESKLNPSGAGKSFEEESIGREPEQGKKNSWINDANVWPT